MRILVAEDERKLARILKQGIEEQGHAVDVAFDGQRAVEMVLGDDYDAVVLDLLLPGRDGADVCREIRNRQCRVPVLILTARSEVDEKVRLLDIGADDYLTKPFVFAELLARLRALLRRGPVQPGAVLSVADLDLDPSTRRVRRSGQEISLTSREFAILEYLMRRPEHVVTRDMIASHVWGASDRGGSNIIEVYINYLRRKIDQGFEPKLIQTVRGVGYSLRLPEA